MMTSNTPEYYKEVSLRLNRVFDSVGLAEDIRWKRINMWIQIEEVKSATAGAYNFFGSQAEATTTPGLNSDIDQVCCMDITALQDLQNWAPRSKSVLVVSDENTPPGYVKLQCIYNDQLLLVYDVSTDDWFKLDRYGRTVWCNYFHHPDQPFDEQHGPAITYVSVDNIKIDNVRAMRLNTWPDQASHWLTRNRRYNWPSQETIGLIQKTGALLVPVGHKHSQEQQIEWRVSISYGEKLLMWLFNSIQYKCYILLKMINKSFIKPVVGDDALSSYHFKTCMFYLIENTPAAIWQADNLLLCVEMCLGLLYIWIEGKNCPNYFIPEENMFQCKMYGNKPGQLLSVLSNLLRQEGRYLVRISCDSIGNKLVRACQTPLTEHELQGEDVTQVLWISAFILFVDLYNALEDAVRMDWIFENRILNRLFFCQEPRQEVNTILYKFLCSFLGSKLASQSLFEETPDQHALDMANELLLCGSSSDVTSGKLKLAAFYLVQNNLEISEDVLNEIHKNYSYKMWDLNDNYQHALQAILSEDLSTTQLISRYLAFPVHYHASEINCTPKALIPEMFSSAESDEVDSDETYLPDIASVDPKFYLYFLEFLFSHWQNKRLHKKVALDNMIYVIRHEKLKFKDTALNLLAYCLMQKGCLVSAYNILCKSMKLTETSRAAKWHIAIIINAAFRFQRGGQ